MSSRWKAVTDNGDFPNGNAGYQHQIFHLERQTHSNWKAPCKDLSLLAGGQRPRDSRHSADLH
jgi:hypothetical protein